MGRQSSTSFDLSSARRAVGAPADRSPEELQQVRLTLAGMALTNPELETDDQRAGWLTEVLEALGLGAAKERRKRGHAGRTGIRTVRPTTVGAG